MPVKFTMRSTRKPRPIHLRTYYRRTIRSRKLRWRIVPTYASTWQHHLLITWGKALPPIADCEYCGKDCTRTEYYIEHVRFRRGVNEYEGAVENALDYEQRLIDGWYCSEHAKLIASLFRRSFYEGRQAYKTIRLFEGNHDE